MRTYLFAMFETTIHRSGNPLIYLYKKSNLARAIAMENEKVCSSCGKRLVGKGITFFKCPQCGATEIGRCSNCRDQGVKYKCDKCGFTGP